MAAGSARPRTGRVIRRGERAAAPSSTGVTPPPGPGEDAGDVDGPFVTLLIADLAGAAGRLRGAGDDGAAAARRAGFATLRAVAAEHGGREVRAAGDGLTVAFAGAGAAVRCAVDMQRATTGADPGAPARIGLAAGEPVADGDDLYGTPVEVARRLCETAAPGSIVATDVVRQIAGARAAGLVHPAGSLRLPGVPERVAVAEVRWRADDDEEPAPAAEPAAGGEITVVIADDQRLLRTGFRVILDSEPDMRVVGEAPDGEAAVDVVRRRRPDVVLMDIRMPELDGLSAARRILDDPDVPTAVVMLTTFDRDEYVYEALRIGASGFLLKDAPAEQLVAAIEVVARGDALLAPQVTRLLIEEIARRPAPLTSAVPGLDRLTEREVEVLRLMARGMSNAEIAAELYLGEATVKTHVGRVLTKLDARDRVQAVVAAYESGLVEPGASR